MIGFGSSKDNEVDQNENETASLPLKNKKNITKRKVKSSRT